MLQPSSPINGTISQLDAELDMTLRWQSYAKKDSIAFVAIIDGQYYNFCGNLTGSAVFIFEATSKYAALLASVDTVPLKNVDFAEWVKIYKLCEQLGSAFIYTDRLDAAYIAMIEQAIVWDAALVNALEAVPQSTVRLLANLGDMQRALVASYINAESPSMQSLKLFIEKVCDFAPLIDSPEYSKAAWQELTEKRSPQHIAADQLLQKLTYAKTADSFEYGQLQFSFTAKSAAEYRDKLQKLLAESDTVEELFKIINPL